MAPDTHLVLDFPIVGIGASAGGITALQELFQALRGVERHAFVVVQHLPPARESNLAKLMQKWTSMPVLEAADGVRPEPGKVYLPRSEHVLTVEQGIFRTRPAAGGQRRPGIDTIDAFLESLAADRGGQSIAVVLSGTGMDGTAGALQVRYAGGIVLVQDPITALHDGMPSAAIKHGAADHVLPVAAIADELAACASPDYVRASPSQWTNDIARTLDEIIALVRQQAGFDFTGYKPSPLLWRIQQRMGMRQVRTFADYEALLRDDQVELEALVRGLPIHVTEFFRDPPAWDMLARDVIAPLVREREGGTPIRVWTPGCATGEEAYSVAMLMCEHLGGPGEAANVQVFATDASPEILARASRGMFPEQAVARLSRERLRFFYQADGAWRVKRSLRENMIFAPHDLLSDPPFTSLDLITCRNVLIYLEPDAIDRVLYMLHGALRMGGYLFLGRGEPLPLRQRGFEAISTEWHIYRKCGEAPVRADFPKRVRPRSQSVPARAHRAALEHLDLPGVTVDEDMRVLHVYGDTSGFLRLPPGEPTNRLLDIAHRPLVPHLRHAIGHVLGSGEELVLDVALGASSTVTIRVTAIPREEGARRCALVSFLGATASGSEAVAAAATSRDALDSLRISHEELEASREELEALNEELKASNEQLNLAVDDLEKSNAALQDKIAQLEMQSRVLSSGAVTTLFLDAERKVRWFTPSVGELFPLMPGDEGRCILDLVPRFDDPAFSADVREVMASGELREAEVRHRDGRWFLRRVRPYVSDADAIIGVAVTFTDITGRKEAEEALRQSEARLSESEQRFRALATARAYAVYRMNPDWSEMRQLDGSGFMVDTPSPRRDWIDEYISPQDQPLVKEAIGRAIASSSPFELEHRVRRPDGSIGWTLSRAVPIFGARGEIVEWMGAATDITERMQVQETLRKAERGYRVELERQVEERTAELKSSLELLQATMDSSMDMIQVFEAVRGKDGQIVDFRWIVNNHTSEKTYGDVIGKCLLENNPGVIAEGIFDTFKRVAETGMPDQSERHYAHEQFDGWFLQSTVKLGDGVATTTANITPLKRAERALFQAQCDARERPEQGTAS